MFRGGVLQIRGSRSGKIISEVANTDFGSAVLFRISENLEHRVTGIEGDIPETTVTGWFKPGPGFHSYANQLQSDTVG